MSKRRKKTDGPASSKVETALVICLSLLAVILACAIGAVLLNRNSGNQDRPQAADDPNDTAVVQTDPTSGLENPDHMASEPPRENVELPDNLPYLLADNRLVIESLYQYSGLNPDCYWQDGTNIGAIVLLNRSEKYVDSITLKITLSDGTVLNFAASDVPGGSTFWLHDTANTAYDGSAVIMDVEYELNYDSGWRALDSNVQLAVEGTTVNVTNQSAEALQNVEVICHNELEGIYFGGASFVYKLDSVAPGETAQVLAEDCILGSAGVVAVNYAN